MRNAAMITVLLGAPITAITAMFTKSALAMTRDARVLPATANLALIEN